jgi:hypothetical protein
MTVAKSLRAQTVEQNSKRRKIEEMNYQAFNVKCDMEARIISKESLDNPVPVDDLESLHTKVMTDIHLDNVQWIDSKRYESAHNLVEETMDNNEEIDYSDLLYSCQHFYSSNGPIPTPSEEETNDIRGQRRFDKFSNHSYSTLSSESGSSTPTPDGSGECTGEELSADCISALFRRNGNKRKKTKSNHDASKQFWNFTKEIMIPSNMTLEDAIESGTNARLVAHTPTDKHEFTIVHCSAAFSRCTGIVSDILVGQSIENMIRIDDEKGRIVTIDDAQLHEHHLSKSFVLKIFPLEKHPCFYVFEFKRLYDSRTVRDIQEYNDASLSNRVIG